MTIDPHDEHGARLRRALHAEMDSVIPSGDGLERIRARVEQRRGRRAFLAARWLKPALAAFGAIAIAGSAAVTAPLLQTVGDSALGDRPPAPRVEGVPAPGQAPPAATSQTQTQTDPSVTPTQQPSVVPSESGAPGTVVECYPQPSQDTEPRTKTAQPSPPTATPSPSPSSSPSVGQTCAPGSSPTATVTMTPTTSPPDCESKPEECGTASPTNQPSESPSPSP